MSIHVLRRTQVIPRPLEECWAFFSDPRNLARITPPALDFRVSGDLPPAIYPGMMIAYRLRPFPGVPMSWLTEITQVDPLRYFADEQRIGPYRLWHHEHFFKRLGERSVEIRDCVHYALPLGIAGDLVHSLFVQKQIQTIFEYRFQAVTELLGETRQPAPG